MRSQPTPAHGSAQTYPVEECRLVLAHAHPQQLRIPARGPRLESRHVPYQLEQAGLAMLAGPWRHVLPLKEKPHEIRRGDGLDFLAQVDEGAAMNHGEQTAMTPLGRRG